jgi:diguanylate cyclase (GGDEF)-like protein/PAS domain S-box-containing protein
LLNIFCAQMNNDLKVIFWGSLLAGIIFSFDLAIPLGVAGGVPYIIVVFFSYKHSNKNFIWVASLVASCLTCLGYFASPAGGEFWKVISNRLLALFAIWATAVNCYSNRNKKDTVRQLSVATEDSPASVMITDINGNITYVNKKFTEITKYTIEEIKGKTPRIFNSGNHPHEFYENLWETVLSGQTWRGEILNKDKEGDLFWEATSIAPIKNKNNQITHFVAVKEDVTEHKKMEIELQNAKVDLEFRVEERTKELDAKNNELNQSIIKYQELENFLRESNAQLENLATSDALTGIANRRAFEQFLEREWKISMRKEQPITAMMIDIDYFKPYNDLYGHQAGDGCLKKVAQSIAMTLKRPGDLVARYGGEEFVAIMTDISKAGVADLAEKVRVSVESLNVPHKGSKVNDVVTISLGIAQMVPDRNASPSILITQADKSLYVAKEEGRNRVAWTELENS